MKITHGKYAGMTVEEVKKLKTKKKGKGGKR
jgi:hypothetical protein